MSTAYPTSLLKALLQAQSQFPVIPKNKTAKVPMKSGGTYSYKYADLADVVAAVTPVLHRNGLLISHRGYMGEKGLLLETSVLHADSGESLQSTFPLTPSNDAQEIGGDITYFRRYALCAILGIVTEEDTDAQGGKSKDSQGSQKSGSAPPQGASLKPPGTAKPNTPPVDPNVITEQQRKLFMVEVGKVGMPEDIQKELIGKWGYKSRLTIQKKDFDAILKAVQTWLK